MSIVVFNDVPSPYKPSSQSSPDLLQQNGDQTVGNVSQMSVGLGNTALYVDKQGLWLGNSSFGSAPFKVDMNGNMTFSVSSGSGSMTISAANQTIIVNDGAFDRVLIGKGVGLF